MSTVWDSVCDEEQRGRIAEGGEPSQYCKAGRAGSYCTAVSSCRPVRLAELQYCKVRERGGGGRRWATALSFPVQVGEAAGGGERWWRAAHRRIIAAALLSPTSALPARRAHACTRSFRVARFEIRIAAGGEKGRGLPAGSSLLFFLLL